MMAFMIPPVADAVVLSQDGAAYRVNVALLGGMGGQGPMIPVDVMLTGFNDQCRGDWPPLPAVGTHGRVLFSRGDLRNGVWIGAHRPGLPDSCAHTAATPSLRYRAEFDGSWFWHDQGGVVAQQWADGTAWLLGNAMPVPTRNTLTSGQVRQAVPFTAAQRNPNPPAPMPLSLTKAVSGGVVTVSINASGAVVVSGLPGQAVSLFGGGCALVMSGGVVYVSGAIQATGPVSGANFVLPAGTEFAGHFHPYIPGSNPQADTGPPVPGS
jgi:hypothetical protein